MIVALIQTLMHVNFDEHHSLIHIKGGIKYLIYSVITTHLISSLSKAGSKWHIH